MQSLELKESQQAAPKDKPSDQRVGAKGLGKRQSPGAGNGRDLG